MIAKIQKFCVEATVELKKVSWLSRQEILGATWVVIVSSFFLGIFIAGIDLVLSKAVGIFIR